MSPGSKFTGCPTPAGYLATPQGKVPVACNKWQCPHCSQIKLMRLSNRVNFGFSDQDVLYMLTITQRLGSKRNIMKDWTRVKQRIERRCKEKMSYFWVKEKQQNGQRHLHVLSDLPIDWRWLKDAYAEITNGESFHIYVNEKPIKHAFAYVMKYLGKDLGSQLMWRPKERKFGFSRDACFQTSGNIPTFERYSYLLGDFWEIIAHPQNKFVRLSNEEASILIDELREKEVLSCPMMT